MLRTTLLGAAFLSATTTATSVSEWERYKLKYGKTYDGAEDDFRRSIYEANSKIVEMHNREYEAGRETWFMEANHLADMTTEEFAKLRSTYTPLPTDLEEGDVRTVFLRANVGNDNPDSVDWRDKGAVTDVKNQGGCGSCWAFSATETVESHYQIASGKLVELAPQTYVNCVQNPNQCGGTGGCEGATMELAFNLTRDSGIALESDMPYKGRDETCPTYNAAVTCDGYVKNPTNDANGLETAIATKGPVSVTVAAEPWQLYGGGVFTGCSKGMFKSNTLDHGVQAVGYTKDYWIVRNVRRLFHLSFSCVSVLTHSTLHSSFP